METDSTTWRERHMWAQTLGRTIERQADGLRRAMAQLADGTGTTEGVAAAIEAIRFQLDQAEKLRRELSPCPRKSLTDEPDRSG
jgi:hypothetical protein